MTNAAIKRHFATDLIKTCAILGVICIHCRHLVDDESTRYLDWVSRCAVPCFIILWALYTERVLLKSKNSIRYLSKRLLNVSLVFTIWSLIYMLFKESWTMPSIQAWLVRHFSGGAWAGQYFFVLLIQLIVLYPLIRYTYERKFLRIPIMVGCVVLYLIMGYCFTAFPDSIHRLKFRPFVYSLPYVYFGLYIARHGLPRLHPIVAPIGLGIVVLEFTILEHLQLTHSAYVTPGVMLGSFLFVTGLWQMPSPSGKMLWLSSLCTLVGTNTMTLFVANPLIIKIFSALNDGVLFQANHAVLNMLLTILLASFIAVIGLLLAFLIRKARLRGILN